MNEEWIPGNKQELMSLIENEWQALIQLAESLTDDQMNKPDSGGWSPKDNLAHIAEWLNILIGYHMDKHPAHEVIGTTEDIVKDWDMEVINPVLFERNKGKSREEVMNMLKQVYDQLKARLESITFNEMLAPRHADDPEKRPLLLWILGDSSDHFKEHRETIEKGIDT